MKKTNIIFDAGHETWGRGTRSRLLFRVMQPRVKNRHLLLIVTLLLFSFASTPAFCQKTKGKSKEQLQKEINTLQKDIATANNLLKKTSKD